MSRRISYSLLRRYLDTGVLAFHAKNDDDDVDSDSLILGKAVHAFLGGEDNYIITDSLTDRLKSTIKLLKEGTELSDIYTRLEIKSPKYDAWVESVFPYVEMVKEGKDFISQKIYNKARLLESLTRKTFDFIDQGQNEVRIEFDLHGYPCVSILDKVLGKDIYDYKITSYPVIKYHKEIEYRFLKVQAYFYAHAYLELYGDYPDHYNLIVIHESGNLLPVKIRLDWTEAEALVRSTLPRIQWHITNNVYDRECTETGQDSFF